LHNTHDIIVIDQDDVELTEEVVIVDGEKRGWQRNNPRTGTVLNFDLTDPLGSVDVARVERHAVNLQATSKNIQKSNFESYFQ